MIPLTYTSPTRLHVRAIIVSVEPECSSQSFPHVVEGETLLPGKEADST